MKIVRLLLPHRPYRHQNNNTSARGCGKPAYLVSHNFRFHACFLLDGNVAQPCTPVMCGYLPNFFHDDDLQSAIAQVCTCIAFGFRNPMRGRGPQDWVPYVMLLLYIWQPRAPLSVTRWPNTIYFSYKKQVMSLGLTLQACIFAYLHTFRVGRTFIIALDFNCEGDVLNNHYVRISFY